MNRRTIRTGGVLHPALLSALLVGLCATVSTAENRSMNGWGNNEDHPTWGMADTQLKRPAGVDYIDGIGNDLIVPPQRANPRVISNTVVAQSGSIPNRSGLTNIVWLWGQTLDHDISLTDAKAAYGTADIPMPPGDIMGTTPMPFNRSKFDHLTGTGVGNPRQQTNDITAYIDGSVIYGSDDDRATWLRTKSDGKLRMSPNGLLPYNDGTQLNAGGPNFPDDSTELFVSGDIRANEQVALSSMHIVLAREHNRLATLLQAQMPGASDEELYQTARRIVGAQMQAITYEEFLPALLGSVELPPYEGYRPDFNASIANEFSTASYRFGHSMLMPNFTLVEPGGDVVGELALRDAFFNPAFLGNDPANVDRLLGGMATPAQEIDSMIIDDVRNFLFGPPGNGGLDLASLNIQRGRDHGLPDYNSLRVAYGLLPKEKFLSDGVLADGVTPNGVTSDPEVALKLQTVYDSVDNMDPWLGGLAEDHLPGSPLSELVATLLVDQFNKLRAGDRFFYLHDTEMNTPAIEAVIDMDSVSLKDIIERNTNVRFDVDNIFVVPEPAAGVWGFTLLLVCYRRSLRAAVRRR